MLCCISLVVIGWKDERTSHSNRLKTRKPCAHTVGGLPSDPQHQSVVGRGRGGTGVVSVG